MSPAKVWHRRRNGRLCPPAWRAVFLNSGLRVLGRTGDGHPGDTFCPGARATRQGPLQSPSVPFPPDGDSTLRLAREATGHTPAAATYPRPSWPPRNLRTAPAGGAASRFGSRSPRHQPLSVWHRVAPVQWQRRTAAGGPTPYGGTR